jgi:hypothetical protein
MLGGAKGGEVMLDGRRGRVDGTPNEGVPLGPDMADVGLSEVRSPLEIVEVCGMSREGLLDDDVGGCGARVGAARLVERLTISFPCTTRLSVDFLRSRVSIWSVRRWFSVSWNARAAGGGEQWRFIPSASGINSIASPIRTLMTPRNP